MPDRVETVFLERDGVINRATEGKCISSWSQFEFLPGALDAFRLLRQAGVRVLVITHQPGIARGEMSMSDLQAINHQMMREVHAAGGWIDGIYICQHDGASCHCQKPEVGLFLRAVTDHPDTRGQTSLVLGPSQADMEAARRLGVAGCLISSAADPVGDTSQSPSFLQAVESLVISPTSSGVSSRTEGGHASPSDRRRGGLRRVLLHPSGVYTSLAANFLGNGIAALTTLAALPILLRLLGVELYGLVGFYASLQGIVAVLDAGLTVTLNRTLAGLSVRDDSAHAMRETLATLQALYWGGSAVICLVLLGLSRFATSWFNTSGVSAGTVTTAVALMGIAVAAQFPFALYSGGLLGMRRQVLQNVISASFSVTRAVGGVLVVAFVSHTIEAYLLFQVIASIAQSLTAGVSLWAILPRTAIRARPRTARLRELATFATGVWAVNVGFITLVQGPRIIASKMLSLKEFGYYSVAFVAASGMYFLAAPVVAAVFPRVTQLVELKRWRDVAGMYHFGSQLMSALALPAGAVLLLLAQPTLLAWTGNPAIASNSASVLGLLAAGTAFHQLYSVPQVLQFATKWTRLSAYLNWIGVAVVIPLTILLTATIGRLGPALGWLILTTTYVTIGVALTHRRIVPEERNRWYLTDVLPAIVVSLAVCGAFRWLAPQPSGRIISAVEVVGVYLVAALGCVLVLPALRAAAFSIPSRLTGRQPAAQDWQHRELGEEFRFESEGMKADHAG